MDELQQLARIAFASEYSFGLKAQNFHWNVEGTDFYEYHELFERIYGEVNGTIDDFAENIRKLQIYTPASLGAFSMLTQVTDENGVLGAQAMVKELLQDNGIMLVILKKTYDAAEAQSKHGFSNYLAERMDAHEKHGWMLRSSSQGGN